MAVSPTMRRLVAVYPYVGLVVVVAVDLGLGPVLNFLAAYSIAPALAAANDRPRRVLWVGAVALGVCLATAGLGGVTGASRSVVAYVTVVSVTLAAAYGAVLRQRLERDRARARRELAELAPVALVARQVAFEPVPTRIGSLELAASYTTAGRVVPMGGDFYGVVTMPTGVRIAVGDVQGKGLEAAWAASRVLAAFREAAPYVESLGRVAERMELALGRDRANERFVTVVLAECGYDGEARILNFGHLPPLLRTADRRTVFIESALPGVPMGLGDLTRDHRPGRRTVHLRQGDRMLLYTDGTVEARDAEGRFFPLADHAHLLDGSHPTAALDGIGRAVAAFSHGAADDDAALVLVGLCPPGGERAEAALRDG
ncbi:PP2C family protein-serine/threonine phosphatase [Streptomyces sp. NPDC093252]|uniref:PP2C family protein-serine/threonine phosphatase n=1 Tax=Streptomyces sp. NPDC093252 TaxID=3154980 RepID=UPI0034349096